jgi:ribosome maturation factor RimP
MRSGVVVSDGVRELIESTVGGLGYELVDVERAANGLLRVSVDTMTPARGIGLDDCERISRQLTHLLAVEQVDYERLEVTSPGLDRPLFKARDFVRFAGSPVQLQLKEPLQGRRRFRGRLLGVDGPAGAERVRLAPVEEGAGAGKLQGAGRGRKTAGKVGAEPSVVLEFALIDIEKARLVPQFDFRARRREPLPGPRGGRTRQGSDSGAPKANEEGQR